MADLRITESTEAGTITGGEALPVAQLSTTTIRTATTISASATGNVLTDSGSGWITAGFAPQQQVRVSGFTGAGLANNITSATIVSLSASELYLDVPLVTVAAGDTVSVTRWLPRKATPAVLTAGSINTATAKATPVDADAIGIVDSAASNALKKTTWANVKATLKTYFDTLYGAGTGTVTSVALSAPAEFTVSGSPVVTTGTLTLTKANQNANLVYAGPSTGSPAAPTFRALVKEDMQMSTSRLLGRTTASTGAVEEITVGSGLSLSGGTLSTSGGGGGGAGSPITYTIDTGSTADSDPGNGLLKFNNATQSSATQIYIDNQTADAVSMTTFLASLAQSGFVILTDTADSTKWRIYKLTASVAATGYYKLTVVNQAGAGSFADDAVVAVQFDSDAAASGNIEFAPAVVTGSTNATTSSYTLSGTDYDVYSYLSSTGNITIGTPGVVDLLMVAGGGGGGQGISTNSGAGGGGGGQVYETFNLYLAAGTYSVVVGNGGAGGSGGAASTPGDNGGVTYFSGFSLRLLGGGGGAGAGASANNAGSIGASGGGGSRIGAGGFGLPYRGGRGTASGAAGGGGGAGVDGGDSSGTTQGSGGAGLSSSIRTGSPVMYAGGGGGGSSGVTFVTPGSGGSGGGGAGGDAGAAGANGTANTGGGGGGGSSESGSGVGGNGGSGIVVVRVRTS